MRTRDLDEAVESVSRVFCPHTVEVVGRAEHIDLRLEVMRPTFQPIVDLAYGAQVKINTNVARYLVMHCARGSAMATQECRTTEWHRGQTIIFSAGFETELRFDPQCIQSSVLLDTEKLEAQCARWLGRPLDRPLQFELRPFSKNLEQVWQRTLAYLRSNEASYLVLSPAARVAFDEYVLTVLLHQHPHNFSREMAATEPLLVPGVVRQAERFMSDNADTPITVSDVANHLGVSLRSLQVGFRNWRNSTPSAVLRRIRLQRVRDELLCSTEEINVTVVALRYGFPHLGRFSAYYRLAFGEPPSVTLRRSRLTKGGSINGWRHVPRIDGLGESESRKPL